MNSRLNGRVCAVGVLVVVAGAAPAFAQALGDGRTLERDLRVGGPGEASSGLAPRPNFMNAVRARNAAVTGNAPNGQSLQIASPYSDPDDFRGSLGTDTLFNFQRDSLGSAYRGPRGTGDYRLSQGLWRPNAPLVTRLGNYGVGSDLPKSANTFRPSTSPVHERTSVNPDLAPDSAATPLLTYNGRENGQAITSPVGTLRSTGAFTSTSELNPALVGYQKSSTGAVQRVTASGLLGVRMAGNRFLRPTDRQEAEKAPEKTAMEAMGLNAMPESPKLSAANRAFRTSYEDLKDRLTGEVAPAPKPGEAEKPGGPEKLLPAGQHAPGETPQPKVKTPEPSAQPTWEERINQLRSRLEKGKTKMGPRQPELTTDQTKVKDRAKTGTPEEEVKPDPDAGKTGKADKNKKNKYAMAGLDEETLAILRKAAGEASTYSKGAPGSLFESHLKAGEEDLSQGKYFDAEERFSRALSMRPGDATVQAARLNAQIGAGLYLSAANSLRQLFQQHPEVIGVRYTGKTMPAEARLKATVDEMRQSIARAKQGNLAPPDEAGLLLAYVGYQTSDAAVTREGLTALRESKDGANDPLVPVLEGVWAGKDSK